MKYQKSTFLFTGTAGTAIEDEATLQTCRDILCSLAGDAGFESFEESRQGIIGYVQDGMLDKGALDAIVASFPVENVSVSYNLCDAEDKDWNEAWENEGFSPIMIAGRCVIHDTLHPYFPDGKMPSSVAGEGFVDITIDAKQAFGTGNHETTRMIVGKLLDMDLSGKRVLDCGCGTGILSIAAAKLGAKEVWGYDIDEWSVRNTKHNCVINGVNPAGVLLGDSSVLDGIEGCFDVVLANINRNILLADMPRFRQKMNENAILIMSGFYSEDAGLLEQKAVSLGLRLLDTTSQGDWCMLVFGI